MKLLENLACRFLIWRFKVGYGANCETSDLDDFSEMGCSKERVLHPGRCPSCRAEETVGFLNKHIEL